MPAFAVTGLPVLVVAHRYYDDELHSIKSTVLTMCKTRKSYLEMSLKHFPLVFRAELHIFRFKKLKIPSGRILKFRKRNALT